MIPVFDGHNDVLLRLWSDPLNRHALWLGNTGKGQLDLPRMRRGGFAGGFFAIYVPSPDTGNSEALMRMMNAPPFSAPLPQPVPMGLAQQVALAMAGHLMWMERQGGLTLCRTASEIRAAMAADRIAAVMHMEGAEAIDPDLDALHLWHQLGLRSLGPVWSRPTIFGNGVPFAYPSSPDIGDGLTAAGHALIRECNQLKIMVDLSHLNEKGFDDVAAISTAPLVATHSNAHAITPASRNLTDRQLTQIAESDGMVGLNYAVPFLRPDGLRGSDCGWDPILRHLDHMLSILGEDRLGLGSDFDGAVIPDVLGDVAGLPGLLQAMRDHGFGAALVEKIASRNWLAVLERTWGQ
ncbi:peptidase [Thioclava sp. SK-1]|uniref:dipeptidase n=1 Tax=Thioclava sp. SK-1 TaxID=1889770 RepID=UPI0008267429|nr:dipeptidase [Thioclava sp. SK-1]OCX63045.1 peptidase [Thioclava sp. SK-1]